MTKVHCVSQCCFVCSPQFPFRTTLTCDKLGWPQCVSSAASGLHSSTWIKLIRTTPQSPLHTPWLPSHTPWSPLHTPPSTIALFIFHSFFSFFSNSLRSCLFTQLLCAPRSCNFCLSRLPFLLCSPLSCRFLVRAQCCILSAVSKSYIHLPMHLFLPFHCTTSGKICHTLECSRGTE
jgi:hypothetical protein